MEKLKKTTKSAIVIISILLSSITNAQANYVKVTTDTTDWSGTYLIASGKNAMNGSLINLDTTNNIIAVTPNKDTIASNTETDAATFTITKKGSGTYSIKSKSGYYIGHTGTTANLTTSQTEAFENTITINATKNAVIKQGKYKLRYNSSNKKFRYYKNTQKSIQLYRYVKESNPEGGGGEQTEKVTIRFLHQGKTIHTIKVAKGSQIPGPEIYNAIDKISQHASCSSEQSQFAGWTEEYAGFEYPSTTNREPAYIDETKTINKSTDLYAVYSHGYQTGPWTVCPIVKETYTPTPAQLSFTTTLNTTSTLPIEIEKQQVISQATISIQGLDAAHFKTDKNTLSASDGIETIMVTFRSPAEIAGQEYYQAEIIITSTNSTLSIPLEARVENRPTEPENDIIIEAGQSIELTGTNDKRVNNLTIKASATEAAGQLISAVPVTITNGITFEYNIDDSYYYFLSLPFESSTDKITIETIANGPADQTWDYGTDYTLEYYDQKASSEGQGKQSGWRPVASGSTLYAGQGYLIALMPTGAKAKVKITSEPNHTIYPRGSHQLKFGPNYEWHTSHPEKPEYKGWNLIGIPYYENFNSGEIQYGSTPNSSIKISIPNPDHVTYTQITLAEAQANNQLQPFTSFFIQTAEQTGPTFKQELTRANIRQNAAQLRTERESSIKVTAPNNSSDHTTIISEPGTTTDYEIGYDLKKWIGYGAKPQIYTLQNNTRLAFNTQEISHGSIEIGIFAPQDGEYTISIDNSRRNDLGRLTLLDRETKRQTDLTTQTYTTTLKRGETNNRFEIMIQAKEDTPTATENKNRETATAYTTNGTLHIENIEPGNTITIYDAIGREQYRGTAASSSQEYRITTKGVYIITIEKKERRETIKTIY